MTIHDSLKVLGITETFVTEEAVKTAYKQACLKFHPDRNPAGHEMMLLLNEAKEVLKKANYPIELKNEDRYNYGEEINNALNKIINIQGLIIEICGSWVWVSGKTKENWPILKEAGFLFSATKKMVYFRPQYAKMKRFKKDSLSIEEIRSKFKSENIKVKNPLFLPAHS